MTSPLPDLKRTLARPVYELLSSQSSSQEIKLGNTSENVGERPTSFDQQIWTSKNVPGSGRMAPKVPGSRPGRPTKVPDQHLWRTTDCTAPLIRGCRGVHSDREVLSIFQGSSTRSWASGRILLARRSQDLPQWPFSIGIKLDSRPGSGKQISPHRAHHI